MYIVRFEITWNPESLWTGTGFLYLATFSHVLSLQHFTVLLYHIHSSSQSRCRLWTISKTQQHCQKLTVTQVEKTSCKKKSKHAANLSSTGTTAHNACASLVHPGPWFNGWITERIYKLLSCIFLRSPTQYIFISVKQLWQRHQIRPFCGSSNLPRKQERFSDNVGKKDGLFIGVFLMLMTSIQLGSTFFFFLSPNHQKPHSR